jgi:hypothetical protein
VAVKESKDAASCLPEDEVAQAAHYSTHNEYNCTRYEYDVKQRPEQIPVKSV